MPKRNQYNTYKTIWGAALSIVFFTASTLQSWPKFRIILEEDIFYFIFTTLLFVVTFFNFLIYAIETNKELDILNDYLDGSKSPRVKTKTYITIFLLAILFAFLMSFSDNILVYCVIIVCLNLFDTWGGWQVSQTIKPLLMSKIPSTKEEKTINILNAINDFYLKNPTLQRVISAMFVNWVGLSFSLIFHYTDNLLLRNMAYVIVIINIIVNESVLYSWRRKRNLIISKNEDQESE